MKRYVLNTIPQSNGDHEVHESNCHRLPSYRDQQDLGYHFRCSDAVTAAKKNFPHANGCYHCSRSCHTEEI